MGGPPSSVGQANGGKLIGATPMEHKGKHHTFTWTAKKKKSNYGTLQMVALLKRAAATVDWAVDGPPLVLGSISYEHGGKIGSHKSHQTGRDVDILFYVVAKDGKRRQSKGFYKFDGVGNCEHKNCHGDKFDLQRNWWLVRTMVWSQKPHVQYIFVSKPLRKLMLAYAKKRGEHPEILRRAAKVMVQPGNSSPHADHFHVRIYCRKGDKTCKDFGPRWDWTRPQKETAKK